MCDLIFEAQFSLDMVEAGQDSLNDVTIGNITDIIKSTKYSSDYRINSLKSKFEKTLQIWGYGNEIDSEELLDLYYKIESFKEIRDELSFIFIKTVKRSLRIKKIVESLKLMNKYSYQRYKKYYGYFDYIINWVDTYNNIIL